VGDVVELFADQEGTLQIVLFNDQLILSVFFLRFDEPHLKAIEHGLFLGQRQM